MRLFFKTLSLALVLCLSFSMLPLNLAFAEDEEITADTPMPNIAALQEQVDAASASYDEANQRIVAIEQEIENTNARILEIQSEMPDARKTSDTAAREYYVMLSSSNTFLEILLGATSMEDFFAKVEYSLRINQSLLDDITKLSDLNAELEEARAALEANKAAIEEEQARAEEALVDAQNSRSEAEETARLIAEATAAATAEAAAAAEAEAHTPEEPVTPGPGNVDPHLPDTPTDKQSFVDYWSPRIDSYLAGSPMAGYGYAFANAAYDYNVDPRYSPAIACLESSKGRYCFLPYNAWGWGSVTWEDWETAIYSHVRGLSRGYSYTVCEADAQKYCPPNWEYWFSFVSTQMEKI